MQTRFSPGSGPGRGRVWCLAVCLVACEAGAVDWPQYRGPNHDGVSSEMVRTNWTDAPPRQIWKIPLEPGLSSFAVGGGKAFTQVRRVVQGESREVCVALNADTGQELWATPLGVADYPDGGVGSDDGPRSTPSVDGGRVYVLTTYLRLACLDAGDGGVLWSRDLVADYGAVIVDWQNAASPLLEGDLLFLNCGAPGRSLLALRQADGSEAWAVGSETMTQASPIAATVAGVRQIIYFARSGLVSVAPADGAVLWRYPFSFSTATAASPVAANDLVYCSAAYGVGAGAVRIDGAGGALAATEAWRKRGANMNHWATPVHYQGYLYGVYGQAGSSASLRCVDIATGTEQWREGGVGAGGVLFTTGLVLVLTEDGFLVLVDPDPISYREVARFRALDGALSSLPRLAVKCWNVPAISNGRIYARSTTEAVCLEVAGAPPAPPPALTLSASLFGSGGPFRLRLENQDHSPLDSNRLANIDVFAAIDLALGADAWMKLTNSLISSNGLLFLDDPQSTVAPQRFFRAVERP